MEVEIDMIYENVICIYCSTFPHYIKLQHIRFMIFSYTELSFCHRNEQNCYAKVCEQTMFETKIVLKCFI